MAVEYRNLGIPLEDLVSEGYVGLIEAARRFDPSKGTRFITYASWWVRKSILEAVSQKSRIIRIPDYWTRKRRNRAALTAGNRSPDAAGGARSAGTGYGGGDVRAAVGSETAASRPRRVRVERELPEQVFTVSLDTRANEDARPLSETLAASTAPSAEDLVIRRELSSKLGGAISRLTKLDRMILRHRFGLEDAPCLSYKQIGDTIGLSHERVRQIETEACLRLRLILSRDRQQQPQTSRAAVAGSRRPIASRIFRSAPPAARCRSRDADSLL